MIFLVLRARSFDSLHGAFLVLILVLFLELLVLLSVLVVLALS